MKRILHMVGTMDMGGQESFIMNVYRNIDTSKYQFDFIVQSENEGYYEKEIRQLGGKIYRISRLKDNPLKHIIQLSKILKGNEYIAFHRHTNSSIVFIDLLVAKIFNQKKIIVHSHSTHSNTNNALHFLLRPFINMFSTYRFACSKEAGKFMYGRKKFEVINNGINVENFLFNPSMKKKLRKKFNIKSTDVVIGHVGRFSDEKNHEFILNFFNAIKNDHTYLLLIGDGVERPYIFNRVCNEGNVKKVLFLGNVNNVNDYLNLMDLFMFPSKYEGLGISLVEAEASGLICMVSDAIPNDAIVTDTVWKHSVKDLNGWVKKFDNINFSNLQRPIYSKTDKIFEYDIKKTADKLCKIYNERGLK